MRANRSSSRRRKHADLLAEALERRQLLNGVALNTSWGSNGLALSTYNGSFETIVMANASVRTPSGETITVGSTYNGFSNVEPRMTITEYQANGQLDPSFGIDGTANVVLGEDDSAMGVALQPNGQILVAGESSTSSSIVEYEPAPQNFRFTVLRLNSNGSLDSTFGSNGVVFVNFPAPYTFNVARAIAVTSGGEIVVAGSVYGAASNENSNYSSMALAELNSNGSLNTSFGSGGTVVTAVAESYDAVASSIAIDSSRRIVVGGALLGGSPEQPHGSILARYSSTGTLDTSFNTSGMIITLAPAEYDVSFAWSPVVIGSTGTIDVVSSYAPYGEDVGGSVTFSLTQYTSSGSLDTTFGSGGTVTWSINTGDITVPYTNWDQLGVLPNGNLVVGGSYVSDSEYYLGVFSSYSTYVDSSVVSAAGVVESVSTPVQLPQGVVTNAVVGSDGSITFVEYNNYESDVPTEVIVSRLTSAGVLDSTFNTSGIAITPGAAPVGLNANTSLLEPDGQLLVAGAAINGETAVLVCFNADGSLDTSFGTNGQVTLGGGFNALALQSNGDILAGTSSGLVARYTSAGVLDPTFGTDGLASVPGISSISALYVVADGQILAGGGSSAARLNSNGSVDTTFGNSSNNLFTSSAFSNITSIAIASDGDILLGGDSFAGETYQGNRTGLIALLPSGVLDTSFGSDGASLVATPASFAGSITILSDGSIVLGGSADVVKFTASGAVDTAFGVNGVYAGGAAGILLLSNGNLLLCSTKFANGGGIQFTELLPSGVPDSTFGTGGTFTTLAGLEAAAPSGAAIAINGDIIVTGGAFAPNDYSSFFGAEFTFVNQSPLTLSGSNYLEVDSANAGQLDVWPGTTNTGSPAASYELSQLSGIVDSAAGGGTVTLNFANGDPIPSGLNYYGAGTADSNQLILVGASSTNTLTESDGQVDLNGGYASLGNVGQVVFAPGSGGNSIALESGTLSVQTPLAAGAGFSSISVGAGALLTLMQAPSGHSVVTISSLTLAGTTSAWTGKLDLANNDLDLPGASLTMVCNMVTSGGIFSSTVVARVNALTTVAVIANNQDGTPLFSATNELDGIVPGASDILVKATYYGDANLSGNVDASDYSLIDNGYLHHLTGWYNGDFNYDGVVNGSDYTLIDSAYNMQGASLADQIFAAPGATTPLRAATPTELFADTSIDSAEQSANSDADFFSSDAADALDQLQQRS